MNQPRHGKGTQKGGQFAESEPPRQTTGATPVTLEQVDDLRALVSTTNNTTEKPKSKMREAADRAEAKRLAARMDKAEAADEAAEARRAEHKAHPPVYRQVLTPAEQRRATADAVDAARDADTQTRRREANARMRTVDAFDDADAEFRSYYEQRPRS